MTTGVGERTTSAAKELRDANKWINIVVDGLSGIVA